ncbi:type I inositol polyphosphate 5-phosphatase 10-like [Cocos nucifera]|uniref:Type I inositol polyphosphate 5-phosphatase 10-like n=1 Tax=Cocos nucifera TaxID=13894 RepID=A0A8K0MVP5_COCNU|nr:type I inositol polyphosphate 5-phosphatase 10-like [Cocos nucifera]
MNKFSANIKEKDSTSKLGSINLGNFSSVASNILDTQTFRLFATTWNVGGKPPHDELNVNELLPADDQIDVYVLGFQEIVPLNAGNVLAIEDRESAVKWLTLINQALNRPRDADAASKAKTINSLLLLQKPSLKEVSKIFRTEHGGQLEACNCTAEVAKKYYRDSCFRFPYSYISEKNSSEHEQEERSNFMVMDTYDATSSTTNQRRYCLIASKQMVGVFLTVWVKRELAQHVGHLRICCVGCGIMGCLGNKGCISVSMTLHQTSFCFVCSHLASGEKGGDELRRNSDVIEILKNTQFLNICKTPVRRIPEKILEHDRVIWLGDLNYRIALSDTETRKLLKRKNWDALFKKDQLKIEREAGRVFKGWHEGTICFPPTYKYSMNSDVYTGEIVTSKEKRRNPAWCDRILWHGDGIVQLSYVRGESKFSDHRPVCAVFIVEVGVLVDKLKRHLSAPNKKVGVEELLPPSSGYFYSLIMQ